MRPVRRVATSRDAAAALHTRRLAHSTASTSMMMSSSRSTGRPCSGPPDGGRANEAPSRPCGAALGWSLPAPLRFGRIRAACSPVSQGLPSSWCDPVAAHSEHQVLEQSSRSFDPMIDEMSIVLGGRSSGILDEGDMLLPHRSNPPAMVPASTDPMIFEAMNSATPPPPVRYRRLLLTGARLLILEGRRRFHTMPPALKRIRRLS